MYLSGVLLRWYRSFNVAGIGPDDRVPDDPWHVFNNAIFPFVTVPIEPSITTVVGANESGKSHLLSAIGKALMGFSISGSEQDAYEIKDICRYCGFSPFDDVFPGIGLELACSPDELKAIQEGRPAKIDGDVSKATLRVTVI